MKKESPRNLEKIPQYIVIDDMGDNNAPVDPKKLKKLYNWFKKALILVLMVFSLAVYSQNTTEQTLQEVEELAKVDPSDYQIKIKLEKLLVKEPKNETALFQMAKFYFSRKAKVPCLKYLEKLIKINPNEVKYYWIRAAALLSEHANEYDLKQVYSDLKIVEGFNKISPIKVLRAQILVCTFLGKNNEKYIKEGLSLYEKAIALDKNFASENSYLKTDLKRYLKR